MYVNRREDSPDGAGHLEKMTLPKDTSLMVLQGRDDLQGQGPAKKFKQHHDGKVFGTTTAGFTITEPTYDFKQLDSPCTITSRSSLVPVADEERSIISTIRSVTPEETSSSSSVAIIFDSLMKCPSSDELTSSSSIIKCPPSDERTSSNSLVKYPPDVSSVDDQNLSSSPSLDATFVDDQNTSGSSSYSSPLSPEHRQLRKKRKTFTSEECPVCGITVRLQDIKEHYKCELKKLDSLKRRLKKPSKELSCVNKKLDQIKSNRAKRSRHSGSKQMKDVAVSTCLVCHPELLDDESAVHARALLHLTECIGVGEDLLEEALQEYSLEAESRFLRNLDEANSMSYNRIENVEDEDSHVNVDSDDDDDIAYGSPQFTEQNLIVCPSNLSDAGQSALREAVLSCSSSDDDAPPPLEVPPTSTQNETVVTCDSPNSSVSEGSDVDENESRKSQENSHQSQLALISALKSRVEELEEQLETRASSKCNICLEHYKNPLVSVNCWHVSCEECWMKTLGAKKLCPQCAKITLPTSLRRIYL